MCMYNILLKFSLQTMERFNHLHLAVSPRTLHRRLEEIGSRFDDVVKQWMADGSVFQLIGDNVDIYQRPRFMTADHRPVIFNWFQVCAVKNRITAPGMYFMQNWMYGIFNLRVARAKHVHIILMFSQQPMQIYLMRDQKETAQMFSCRHLQTIVLYKQN